MMNTRSSAAAFALIELMVYGATGCIVSMVAFSALRSAAVLALKNTNINRSHDDLRSAYDRLARNLLSANNVPVLVDTAGAIVTGPAAGFSFVRNLGGGRISSILPPRQARSRRPRVRSMSGSPPPPWGPYQSPRVGEILVIPTAGGNIRDSISGVSPSSVTVDGTPKMLTLTFTAPIAKSLSWGVNEPQAGKLVRPEGFLVLGAELRYYPIFQPLPVLSNPANYKLLTDQISTQAGEQTPFDVTDFNGDRIPTSTLQVRERQNAQWISGDEANSYNTYFQLHVNLPSRLRPRTEN